MATFQANNGFCTKTQQQQKKREKFIYGTILKKYLSSYQI